MAGRKASPPTYEESTDGGKDGKKVNKDDNIMEKLSSVGNQAPKLVAAVNDSVQGTADALEKLRKNIAESVKHCSPSISMRLTELQTFLEEVVRKCHSYCDACKDLGDYGSDEELIKGISEDLDMGQFDELKDYLEEIEEFLVICEDRFRRYETAGEAAKKEVKGAADEFEKKRDAAMESQRKERIAAGVVGTIGGGLTGGGALLTFFNPPAGIAMMMAGVATGAGAAGLTIDAGYTQAQIDIFNHACRSVIALNSNLAVAMRTAEDMRENIYKIKTAGVGIEQLKSKTKRAEGGGIELKRLKAPLRGIKRKMGQLSNESTRLMDKLDKL